MENITFHYQWKRLGERFDCSAIVQCRDAPDFHRAGLVKWDPNSIVDPDEPGAWMQYSISWLANRGQQALRRLLNEIEDHDHFRPRPWTIGEIPHARGRIIYNAIRREVFAHVPHHPNGTLVVYENGRFLLDE